MKINLSQRFKRAYKKLPSGVKDDFDRKIALFIDYPGNPKLRTHKLKGKLQTCFSFYLVKGYRVLFDLRKGGEIDLLDVGPHDRYKRWGK